MRGVALLLAAAWATGPAHSQDAYPVRQLTFGQAQGRFASWVPDGAMLVHSYLQNTDTGVVAGLWTVPVAGGSPRRLTTEIPLIHGGPPREIATSHDRYPYPDMSPDGELLAYTWCAGRVCDLWLMPAVGGMPVRLTTDPALDDGPRWFPDGTKLAFTSTRAESFDHWVMSLDLDRLRRDVAAGRRR
jgi:Tol biopolymer transport system component